MEEVLAKLDSIINLLTALIVMLFAMLLAIIFRSK